MGRYDITVKYFAAKYPQAYIRLALGAVLGPSTPAQEVQAVSAFRLLDKKLPEVELEVDFLAEVTHAGETFVLHPDFQTRYDSEMRERMQSMTNDQLTMTNAVDWTLDILEVDS
jgi:hypothetical protein